MEQPSAPGQAPMAAIAKFVTAPIKPVSLDDVDVRILAALRQDSRLSQRALAKEVGLSAPAIGDRVARLERLRVIQGYTVRIGWAEAGHPMVAHLSMSVAAGADLAAIIDGLSQIPELIAAHIVTGQWDVLARFRLADQLALQNLLLGKVWQIPGIQRVETNLELVVTNGLAPLHGLTGQPHR